MNIAMLTMEQHDNRRLNSVGSSRIRGRWMMKYCPEIVPFKNGTDYDAVIYQKAYYKEHMEGFKGVKIFDLCDPDWLEGRPVTEIANLCDAFTCPTQAMHDFLVQITDKPVVIIPDRVDPEEHTPVKEKHYGKARSVVWYGYSTNQIVLDKAMVFLESQMLDLVVVSDRNYPAAAVNVPYNYDTVNEELIKHDMVLMPEFKSNYRHSFKSNNKTICAWALKMPVATNPDEILRFMDPDERNKEAEMRYNEVMTNYHVKNSGPQYIELVKQIQQRREVK